MDFIFEISVKNHLEKTLYISGANSLLACVILAQLNVGNNSDKLKNEIRQLLYYLYCSKN